MFNIRIAGILRNVKIQVCMAEVIGLNTAFNEGCARHSFQRCFFSSTPLKTMIFFHPKGDTLFDTLVYRRGHSLNHHFLVLFLPITLTTRSALWQKIKMLWLYSTSSLWNNSLSSLLQFWAIPTNPSPGSHQRKRQGHLSGFLASNWASHSILWNAKAGNLQQFTHNCPESITCQLHTQNSLISVSVPALKLESSVRSVIPDLLLNINTINLDFLGCRRDWSRAGGPSTLLPVPFPAPMCIWPCPAWNWVWERSLEKGWFISHPELQEQPSVPVRKHNFPLIHLEEQSRNEI